MIIVVIFRQFMTSLQLDPGLFEQTPDRLPQDLLEKCAAMSVRTNAIKDLVESMSGKKKKMKSFTSNHV